MGADSSPSSLGGENQMKSMVNNLAALAWNGSCGNRSGRTAKAKAHIGFYFCCFLAIVSSHGQATVPLNGNQQNKMTPSMF
eukprot:6459538-Amphidinium_carterae.1